VTVVPFGLDHAIAVLRVVAGLLLLGHGAQKLFGAFGSPGIRGFAGWLGSLGLPAPVAFAWFVGLCEFLGGLLFLLGFVSPIAAVALSGVMLGAIVLVHWSKGIWASKGGLEFPLVLLAIAFVVGLAGPGRYALDSMFQVILPATAQSIYIAGRIIEIVALTAVQIVRTRQPTVQSTTAWT
jgi:putative oxidoreductase